MVAPVDIEAFIDASTISRRTWLLVLLCFLVLATDGMDLAIMGFVAPLVMREWGVPTAAFGLVLGAAPIGLVLGGVIGGFAADRFGRRPVLIASVAAFGILTILAAGASSLVNLAAFRCLAGAGMGAAMPNALTLVSEYAPKRRRGLLVTLMFTGFNLGSGVIGIIAGMVIPDHGWRAVLLIGGAAPLLLVPVLFMLLPESARLLAHRGASSDKIGALLGRMSGHRFGKDTQFVSMDPGGRERRAVREIVAHPLLATSISLWLSGFCGLLVIYLVNGWLPTILQSEGASIDRASYLTAAFQLGATLGAILIGWLMDHWPPRMIIALAYLGGAVCLASLSHLNSGIGAFGLVVFAAGACMSGGQTGLNAFAPVCYPTGIRATGVSWMLGIARLGGILGFAVGGLLLQAGSGGSESLLMLAGPALLACCAIGVSHWRSPARTERQSSASPTM